MKDSKDTISQYTPIDEDEHKEVEKTVLFTNFGNCIIIQVDRKANLNSARVFLYQGKCLMIAYVQI